MKLEMDRITKIIKIEDLEKGDSVTITFGKKEALVGEANKSGVVKFNCAKLIPKYLRKEIPITVRRKGQNDIEAVYEVRMTKLVHKRDIEIRKEK